MPKSTAIEYERRIRAVMEWLTDDWPHCDIKLQLTTKYNISESQAKKDLATAYRRWEEENTKGLLARRSRRIQSLKRLKKQLEHTYKGSPYGLQVILQYEREIARLEGIEWTKEELEAERRPLLESTEKLSDPLSPELGVLKIQMLPPYDPTATLPTANTEPT